MLIYTTVPMEQIFPNDAEQAQYQELEIGEGKKMVVERISENESRVVRLISTDCNDYLNPKYQPGTVINLQFL